MKVKRTDLLLFIFVVFAAVVASTSAIAVMSVDLGLEWMKIAIVKPGVPMEIVLNKESRRKTPVAVSMRGDERLFGDDAVSMGVRHPTSTYLYLLDLLGKKVENPAVELYQKRFPYHKILPDPTRGTVTFVVEEQVFSVEEIVSMILRYAKTLAEDFAEQRIRDCVITVPVYFNQAERRAVLAAAELADLRVLQVINDNTAVALHYGVFRRKDFNTTPQTIMFVDQGSASTTATIATYQVVKTKERGYTETNPQVTIRGIGFDRTLGGVEMQIRLQQHLADLFMSQKKTKGDIRDNNRAMAKLYKEAGRLKKVLSANTDHVSQVEGLLEDKDFASKVTREQFENLCEDLFDRMKKPLEDALKRSEMTLDEISQVIIVGGNTRVPKIQEIILKTVGREELGKSVNADEAAAMGAVYQAAHLSKKYKVKRFMVRDATLYPIQVDFAREIDEQTSSSPSVKFVSRTLFALNNPFPQKKVITFNKHQKDFEFFVNYGDLTHLSKADLLTFGSRNISTIELTGVSSALLKHGPEDSKGVKAHFRVDEGGVLTLDSVESVFEKIPVEEPSTFQKIGSTISNLFGGGDKVEEKEKKEDSGEKEEQAGENDQKSGDTPGKSEEDEKSKKDDENTAEKEKETPTEEETKKTPEEEMKKPSEEEDKKGNKSSEEKFPDLSSKNATEQATNKSSKPQVVKEPINVVLKYEDLNLLEESDILDSKKKLNKLDLRDLEKLELEKKKNELESFIYETLDKIRSDDKYDKCSTEAEKKEIEEKFVEQQTWLDEEGFDASTQEYTERLSTLRTLTKDLRHRVSELEKRPEALQALTSMLNYSQYFLYGVRNLTEDLQIFTDTEIKTLETLINTTTSWRKEKLDEQKKSPLTLNPVLTIQDIAEKVQALDREVKYLLNKAKTAKPKTKKTNDTAETSTSQETEDGKSESEEEKEPEGEKEGDAETVGEKEEKSDDKDGEEVVEEKEPGDEESQEEIEEKEENIDEEAGEESIDEGDSSQSSQTPNPEL